MKTERRHELQTNELADWLGKHIETYKPELKYAGGAVVVLLVFSAVYLLFQQHKAAQSGVTWGEFLQASLESSPDEQGKAYQDIANRNAGTDAGLWAMLSEADLDLSQGSELLFSDRELALVELERAKKNFSQVEQEAARNPVLLLRARFGLAQTLECLGELSKAKEKFELVHKSALESALGKTTDESVLGKIAEKRAKRLDDKSIVEFYAWFEKQKPRTPHRPGSGKIPFRMDDLPDRPDLSFPGSGQFVPSPSIKPSDDKDAEKEADKDATDKPEPKADGDKPEPKADGEKPDPAKPAAESEKPATEKPATDKPAPENAKPSPSTEKSPPAPSTEPPKK